MAMMTVLRVVSLGLLVVGQVAEVAGDPGLHLDWGTLLDFTAHYEVSSKNLAEVAEKLHAPPEFVYSYKELLNAHGTIQADVLGEKLKVTLDGDVKISPWLSHRLAHGPDAGLLGQIKGAKVSASFAFAAKTGEVQYKEITTVETGMGPFVLDVCAKVGVPRSPRDLAYEHAMLERDVNFLKGHTERIEWEMTKHGHLMDLHDESVLVFNLPRQPPACYCHSRYGSSHRAPTFMCHRDSYRCRFEGPPRDGNFYEALRLNGSPYGLWFVPHQLTEAPYSLTYQLNRLDPAVKFTSWEKGNGGSFAVDGCNGKPTSDMLTNPHTLDALQLFDDLMAGLSTNATKVMQRVLAPFPQQPSQLFFQSAAADFEEESPRDETRSEEKDVALTSLVAVAALSGIFGAGVVLIVKKIYNRGETARDSYAAMVA